MKVNINELSETAQIELLQHFPMDMLTGMLRIAGLQSVKTKELAATNLVKSGKLTYSVDLFAGIKAEEKEDLPASVAASVPMDMIEQLPVSEPLRSSIHSALHDK